MYSVASYFTESEKLLMNEKKNHGIYLNHFSIVDI